MNPETTIIPPHLQPAFLSWLQRNQVTDLDARDSHYDYRGAFMAGIDRGANGHWPDTYKQHGHPTFSVESKYSKGSNDGGSWNGEQFIPQAQSTLKRTVTMPGGFGMGVVPAQVGQAMSQAPPSDLHQDPLPFRSDPPREHTPRPVDPNVEHSDTATRTALSEAMQRMQGARKGEYQLPTSPLAIDQMKRAGLSDAELAILLRSNPADATAVAQPSGPAGYNGAVGSVTDIVNHLGAGARPTGPSPMTSWSPPDPRSTDRRRIAESMRNR